MFLIDTTKYFKIWFSHDKKTFLGPENQLRLIRDSQNNPHASITFVYSSKCLDENSQENLIRFCGLYKNIKPMDFDTQIKALLVDEQDIAMYNIALLEIARAITHQGGNLGAASDCVRLLRPLLAKVGNYLDFDVELNASSLLARVPVRAPVLLSMVFYPEPEQFPAFNSDILIAAIDSENQANLDPEAFSRIGKIQEKIINKYRYDLHFVRAFFRTPLNGVDLCAARGVPWGLEDKFVRRYLQYYTKKKDPNIFLLRQAIENFGFVDLTKLFSKEMRAILSDNHEKALSEKEVWAIYVKKYIQHYERENSFLSPAAKQQLVHKEKASLENRIQVLKHAIYLQSVCRISGSLNYLELFLEKPEPQLSDSQKLKKTLACMKDYSLIRNGLNNSFKSPHTQKARNIEKMGAGLGGDLSWTAIGMRNQRLREVRMPQAARTIQNKWRKHCALKQPVDEIAKTISNLSFSQASAVPLSQAPLLCGPAVLPLFSSRGSSGKKISPQSMTDIHPRKLRVKSPG